jgi:putative transposase
LTRFWRRGGVVTQRPAKPLTRVRFSSAPLGTLVAKDRRGYRCRPGGRILCERMFVSEGKWRYRTFRFQLRPDRYQRQAFERAAAARRFAYNLALERWRAYYRQTGSSPSRAYLCREITKQKHKPGFEWLREISSKVPQQAVADLWSAYQAFFNGRARYPRFRSRKRDSPRFRFPGPVKIRDDLLYVPRVGWTRMRISRPVTGEIRSVTIRQSNGQWIALVLTRFEVSGDVKQIGPGSHFIGIDLGLIRLATTSDGRKLGRPRFAAKADKRLRKAGRRLSRREEGSRSWHRAQRRLAALHAKTAAKRLDFLHKTITSLVRAYDGFAVDLVDARGLARTKLSASVMDAALGEFRRQLAYKADWERKPLVVVGRFYPSTKRCSKCGWVNPTIGRSQRTWTCRCGAIHDRDLNAAENIRQEGLRLLVAAGHADTENACGVHVRPPREATDDETGISMRECQPVRFRFSPVAPPKRDLRRRKRFWQPPSSNRVRPHRRHCAHCFRPRDVLIGSHIRVDPQGGPAEAPGGSGDGVTASSRSRARPQRLQVQPLRGARRQHCLLGSTSRSGGRAATRSSSGTPPAPTGPAAGAAALPAGRLVGASVVTTGMHTCGL